MLFGKKDRQTVRKTTKKKVRVHRPREAEIETDERNETGGEKHTHRLTETENGADEETETGLQLS